MATAVKVRHAIGQQVGDTVFDRRNLFHRFLPEATDRAWRCVGFIDVYGDTRFNRLQLDDVIEELDRLKELAALPEWHALLGEVRALAVLARSRPMYFLEFIGD